MPTSWIITPSANSDAAPTVATPILTVWILNKPRVMTMRNEIRSVLRTDFLSFARKAILWMEGTTLSRDRYLELLASELSAFANGETKQLLINLPPRHLKTLL